MVYKGLLLLLSCLTGGCFSGLPLNALDMDSVQEVKREEGQGVDGKLVIALHPGEAGAAEPTELEEDRYAVPFSSNQLLDSVSREISALHLFREVVTLQAEEGNRALLTRARDEGAAMLLTLTPKSTEVRYLGHNGWWVPNFLLWFFVLVPSWYVPDETYSADVEFEATLYDLRKGAEVMREPFRGSQELRLNDFQRGWHFWGVFGGALSPSNYEDAGAELSPLAMNRAKAEMYVKIAACLPGRETPETEKPTPSPEGATGTAALVIGISQPKAVKTRAVYPSADALRIVKAIKGSPLRLEESQVKSLRDTLATAEAIRRELKNLPRTGKVIFYFAGFGARKAGKAYLVPYDGDPTRPEETCIPVDEIATALKKTGAAHRIILVDAGFSGSGPRSAGSAEGDLLTLLAPAQLYGGLCALFSAGPDGQAAESDEFEGGIFTHVLVRCLGGFGDQDGDGRLTTDEAARVLGREVPAKAMALALEQSPLMAGKGDLVLLALDKK